MRILRGCMAVAFLVPLTLNAQLSPKGAIALFNGENLDGFHTYLTESKYEDPKQVFSVRDGILRISGEEWGGATFAPHKDRARDSGILVHGTGPDGAAGGRWLEFIEYQIIEGGAGDFILVAGENRPSMTVESRRGPHGQWYRRRGGKPVRMDSGRSSWFARDPEWKDTLGYRGPDDIENPVGEWNTSEVICQGDTIAAIVNGTVVNHGTGSTHTRGKIQIQSEGAGLLIQRIELRLMQQIPYRGLTHAVRSAGRAMSSIIRLAISYPSSR
ncbi:MAG: DUF1080 domain-containing protein [bacterium]|nr:DUF1080 domain-containing protein [bacterium]